MLDQRGRLLLAALGFAGLSMPSYDRGLGLHCLRTWLDSWAGIGRVAVGMARQGYDLQLTRHDAKGWRATFYTRAGWSTRRRARRVPRGNLRCGALFRERRGAFCVGRR